MVKPDIGALIGKGKEAVETLAAKGKVSGLNPDNIAGVNKLRAMGRGMKAICLLPIEILDAILGIIPGVNVLWSGVYFGIGYAFFGKVPLIAGIEGALSFLSLAGPIGSLALVFTRWIPFLLIYALFFDEVVKVDEVGEKSQADTEKSDRQRRVVETSLEIDGLSSRQSLLETRVAKLKAELADAKKDEPALIADEDANAVVTMEIKVANDLVIHYREMIRANEGTKKPLEAQVKQLTGRLGKASGSAATEIAGQIADLQLQITELTNTIIGYQSEIAQTLAAIGTKQIAQVPKERDAARRRAALDGKVSGIKEKLKAAETELNTAKEQILTRGTEINQNKGMITSLNESRKQATPERKTMSEEVNDREAAPSFLDAIKTLFD